jgi:hypothetical protein
LLNGISRDALSWIFWTDFVIVSTPRRATESLSLDLHLVTKRSAALEL